jgi:hypothetical protein
MDGRRIDAVTDESLDREMESLLAVEPSPDFLARVRARVAEEPLPRRWRTSWMFASAAAVAAAVVALLAWPASEQAPSRPAPVEPPHIVDAGRAIVSAPVTQPSPVPKPVSVSAGAAVPAPDRAIDIALPEVMIAGNEVAAYTALVASIRQSRFDVAVPAALDLDAPIEIKGLPPIEPIEIEPIVKLAALQAEGERP